MMTKHFGHLPLSLLSNMGSLIHRMVHLHGRLSPRTLSIPWPLVGIRPHVTEALDGRYFRPTTGRNHLITTRESSLTLSRYTYKNAVSNGGFFQMAARLARFTGNNTYYEWAERVWDWTTGVGFIDESYRIFDGASTTDNCSEVSQLQWTYNPGLFIYGSAMLYNYTNGSSVWETRLTGLVEHSTMQPMSWSKRLVSPTALATTISTASKPIWPGFLQRRW